MTARDIGTKRSHTSQTMKNASAKATGATTLRAARGRENNCSALPFVAIAYPTRQ
jgi:hypothetical protein